MASKCNERNETTKFACSISTSASTTSSNSSSSSGGSSSCSNNNSDDSLSTSTEEALTAAALAASNIRRFDNPILSSSNFSNRIPRSRLDSVDPTSSGVYAKSSDCCWPNPSVVVYSSDGSSNLASFGYDYERRPPSHPPPPPPPHPSQSNVSTFQSLRIKTKSIENTLLPLVNQVKIVFLK